MLSTYAYTQLARLVFSTLLLLPMAVPNPVPRQFHNMLNSEEDDLSSRSDLGVSDYQSDVFDNRITVDNKQVNRNNRLSSSNLPPRKDVSKLLRPSPSDELPIKYLMLATSKDKLPKEHDRRSARKTLGEDFDSNFMSESRPLEHILKPNGSLNIDYKNYKNELPKKDLPPEIRHLTFNIPGKKHPAKIKSKKQRRKLRQKLWAHISCPVVYKWRDLGPHFWPRWVKEGHCYKAHSCSIPAGMTCKPQQQTEKTFLFWRCSYRSTCDWIKFQYPIITKCKCGC